MILLEQDGREPPCRASSTIPGPEGISVVIPTHERRASLLHLLRALERQTVPPHEFEVVVSIDGSRDGTLEAVESLEPAYVLRAIWQPHRGRAAACNSGIRAAERDLLILLDDDMDPSADLLAEHRRAHVGNSPSGVMGTVRGFSRPTSPPAERYLELKFERIMERLRGLGEGIGFNDAYTGNFSISRQLLLEIGAFDETFKVYGGEDAELALRLQKAGVLLRYHPSACATQRCLKDFGAVARDAMNQGRMAVLLATKHPEAYGILGLGTRGEASRRWRLVRGALLALLDSSKRAPSAFIRWIERLERWGAARRPRHVALALDCLYWIGVREALRERGGRLELP